MLLPDSLTGAGILSLLDFILSCLFISIIGLLLSMSAYLNKLPRAFSGKGKNHD